MPHCNRKYIKLYIIDEIICIHNVQILNNLIPYLCTRMIDTIFSAVFLSYRCKYHLYLKTKQYRKGQIVGTLTFGANMFAKSIILPGRSILDVPKFTKNFYNFYARSFIYRYIYRVLLNVLYIYI